MNLTDKHRANQTWWNVILVVSIIVVIGALMIPLTPLMPSDGLDPSWVVSMNQAVAQNLILGRDFIFTYGPYASVQTRTYHPEVVGLMLSGSIILALGHVLALSFLLRGEGKVKALLILTSFGVLAFGFEARTILYPLLLCLCVHKSCAQTPGTPTPRGTLAMLIVISATLGLVPLIKGSFFATTAAGIVASVVILFRNRKHLDALLVTGAVGLSLPLLWVLSGQPIDALDDYFTSMMPMISGFTEAMSFRGRIVEPLAFVIAALTVAWSIYRNAVADRLPRIVLTLMFLAVLFVSFKAGFVRHDAHALTASSAILLASSLALLITPSKRLPISFLTALASFLFISAHYVSVTPSSFIKTASRQMATLWAGIASLPMSETVLLPRYNQALSDIHRQYNLPQLEGTSDIYSVSQSALIASGNRYNPRPIPQSYSAYTPFLAQKNLEHLTGAGRPDNVFFSVQYIDNRLPSLEDGPSWAALLKLYSPVARHGDFLLLRQNGKTALDMQNAHLATVQARLGEEVIVPDSDSPVLMRASLDRSLIGKLWSVLLKPSELEIRLTLNSGQQLKHRYVASMGKSDFLISPMISNTDAFSHLHANSRNMHGLRVKSFSIVPKRLSIMWQKSFDVTFSALPPNPTTFPAWEGDRVGTFSASTGMEVRPAEHCDLAIDYLNQTTPAPARSESHAYLSARGWMAISAANGRTPSETHAFLRNRENGEYFFSKTVIHPRADVANHFGHPGMTQSGYKFISDIRHLKGEHEFGLAYRDGNTMHVCKNGTVTVMLNP